MGNIRIRGLCRITYKLQSVSDKTAEPMDMSLIERAQHDTMRRTTEIYTQPAFHIGEMHVKYRPTTLRNTVHCAAKIMKVCFIQNKQ